METKRQSGNDDPAPDIPRWLMFGSFIIIASLPIAGWYILSSAFTGLIYDLYVPFMNAGDVITVRSFDLAGPMFVLALIAIGGVMGIVILAGLLNLPQSTCNRVFRPFGFLAIIGLVLALLAKPAAWGISNYLESSDYYQCEEHSRISPFNTTRTYVRDPRICAEL